MSVCGGEFNSEQMASIFSQCKEKSRFRRNIEEQGEGGNSVCLRVSRGGG